MALTNFTISGNAVLGTTSNATLVLKTLDIEFDARATSVNTPSLPLSYLHRAGDGINVSSLEELGDLKRLSTVVKRIPRYGIFQDRPVT